MQGHWMCRLPKYEYVLLTHKNVYLSIATMNWIHTNTKKQLHKSKKKHEKEM